MVFNQNLFNYNEYRDDNLDKSIENDIINNYYDVIIYGSINRGCPFIELVKNKYEFYLWFFWRFS